MEGGKRGEDGKESLRINYSAVFTYVVKVTQELHDIVKLQKIQIEELKTKLC